MVRRGLRCSSFESLTPTLGNKTKPQGPSPHMCPSECLDVATPKLDNVSMRTDGLMFQKELLNVSPVEDEMVVPPVHHKLVGAGWLEISL